MDAGILRDLQDVETPRGKGGGPGPELRGELLKRSNLIRDWRPRWFELRERVFYYYDSEDEANQGLYKGYGYTTGARIEEFIEKEGDNVYYGFTFHEEYGCATKVFHAALETEEPMTYKLCTSNADQRNQWIHALRLAARPKWIPDADAMACMQCQSPFTMAKRRSHCRKCGGVMCKKCLNSAPLPMLMFEEPQKVCGACLGGEHASRHIDKVPRANRSRKTNSTKKTMSRTITKWFGS